MKINGTKIRELRDYAKIIRSDPNYNPKQSFAWFKTQIAQLGQVNTKNFVQKAQFVNLMPGNFYIFQYDPKHKDTLPYWDKFPLVVPFNRDDTSFIGLNLHYLPPKLRLVLLSRLEHFKVMGKDNQHRLLLQWDFIKNVSKYPEVAPCVKRYLFDHLKSKFLKVPEDDWVVMSQIPTHHFVGAKDSRVWEDSRKAIGK